MTFAEIATILDTILTTCGAHVAQSRGAIRNERYFHHMFSFLTAQQLGGGSCWDQLNLHPEYPTTLKFDRNKIGVYDARKTALEGVGVGRRRGNLDFMIAGSPRTLVEWKGPNIFSEKELLEVLLKLLTEPEQDIKVIAGIFTSGETDRGDHRRTVVERFNKYLNFAKQVLQEKSLTTDMSRLNLYACLASIPSGGPKKIHWGQVTADLVLQ
jgi:hypothetical protein